MLVSWVLGGWWSYSRVRREPAGHKGIHSPFSTAGHHCGIYKHIVPTHMLINASYYHMITLSVKVDCLEKVIPFHFFNKLIVPGTTSWNSRLVFHCHSLKLPLSQSLRFLETSLCFKSASKQLLGTGQNCLAPLGQWGSYFPSQLFLSDREDDRESSWKAENVRGPKQNCRACSPSQTETHVINWPHTRAQNDSSLGEQKPRLVVSTPASPRWLEFIYTYAFCQLVFISFLRMSVCVYN